jgi:anaerobic magnesium-protoporphyrin IX monomethyl ester cyclase
VFYALEAPGDAPNENSRRGAAGMPEPMPNDLPILFVSPSTATRRGAWQKSAPPHPHLGLAYLISALKQNGIRNVSYYDQGMDPDINVLFEQIRKTQPALIGITTFSYTFGFAIELVKQIKTVTSAPIVLGGPHVSAAKAETLEEPRVDFAMYGECDITLPQFIREMAGARDFKTVPNLIWRDANGQVVVNPAAPLIRNVDDLPFPDWESCHYERYHYYQTRQMPIITSRGCPHDCNYCSVKLTMGRTFRPRSPANILAEIRHWQQRYGISNFSINDDYFNANLRRAEAFCDLLVSEKANITYSFPNGIRADRVTEQFLRKMKQSGCIAVNYGCESGNQEVLTGMGKSLKLEHVENAVNLSTRAGIPNAVTFIIGHKGETLEKALESVAFAARLNTDFVTFYNLIPYPGTDVYDWARQNAKNMLPAQEFLQKQGYMDLDPVFETDDFNREDRIKALRAGFALHQKTLLRHRFGKALGGLLYVIFRNKTLFDLGERLLWLLRRLLPSLRTTAHGRA